MTLGIFFTYNTRHVHIRLYGILCEGQEGGSPLSGLCALGHRGGSKGCFVLTNLKANPGGAHHIGQYMQLTESTGTWPSLHKYSSNTQWPSV